MPRRVGRVPQGAEGSRERCLVRSEVHRSATPQHRDRPGWKHQSPPAVLALRPGLMTRPRPRRHTTVARTSTVPASRSTASQTSAAASPIRSPVAVNDRLWACGHLITPIRSIYRWAGQVHDQGEGCRSTCSGSATRH
ncbi:divalent cation tolerance protein CutA [Actinopolymorpha sp. NPDC004070]|uniref:divalent cation tolerance protein CutA n=1 Tax=Actinopolymorpha sp. NPDC004070 TaxID=3154548 RepID=UPI00339DD35E